jgi:putative phage-type endonuclease
MNARREWLDRRKQSIGASEVAALLGLSPYESPYSLWAKKVGIDPPSDDEPEWVRWGHLIEPIICDEYARETGRKVIDHGRYAVRYSETCPHLSATLDREVAAFDDRGPGVMDAKNAGFYKGADWDEAPPLLYQVQVQAQLEVTGYQWGSLAVLIGGNTFRWCDIERDDVFIAMLRRKVAEFWRLVETNTPPAVDGSSSTAEVLRRLYPNDKGTTIALSGEAMQWTDEYQEYAQAGKDAGARQQLVKNKLMEAIGENTFGVCPDGSKWSYKSDKNGKRTLRLMGR